MSGWEWVAMAACAAHPTLPPDRWQVPPRRRRPKVPEEVRRVCLSCPVFRQCDQHADEHEEWGVWAGRDHFERYGREPLYERSVVKVERSDKGRARGGGEA